MNIIKGDLTDQQWNEDLPKAITEIFELTVSLGGTLSGEHGIGLQKKKYLLKEHPDNIPVMKSIKRSLDVNNIMNPGKIFDLN